jgi:hypothetical protein
MRSLPDCERVHGVKHRHGSRDAAKRHLRNAARRAHHHGSFGVYQCKSCRGWFIGRKDKGG